MPLWFGINLQAADIVILFDCSNWIPRQQHHIDQRNEIKKLHSLTVNSCEECILSAAQHKYSQNQLAERQ